ncbi:MAG TPA: hypothetical protein VN884_02550 [Candidatus Sulfotelmatobacter sp.]|nr:hypothetical protein [Candidatus Sulfotelmatobacter sp.]
MKNDRKSTSLFLQVLAVAVLLFLAAPNLLAQSSTSSSSGGSSSSGISSNGSVSSNSFNFNFRNNPATNYNPPPCDFLNGFYNNVGMSTKGDGVSSPPIQAAETADGVDSPAAQRFGLFRKTGPPALFPSQVNWVIDNTCGTKDAIRNNVRILATTGGYSDDELGSPTHFINIMAFVMNQSFFETSFTSDPDNLGAISSTPNTGINTPFAFDCTPPPQGTLPTAGCVSITNGNALNMTGSPQVGFGLNARNINATSQTPTVGDGEGNDMQDIVANFEAYPAPKQRLPNGTFAVIPCGTLNNASNNPATIMANAPNPPFAGATLPSINTPDATCFPVTSIATPTLRQDWRFATNRNAIDGSDNNQVTGSGKDGTIVFNSPYGYFCDDLLGMWINSYFWLTQDPGMKNGPCTAIYNQLGAMNGFTTDGTPVVKTGNQLDVTLEAAGCAAEGQLDLGGADGGAVWLICPAIADPTNGAISLDAFLDQVHFSSGVPVDPGFTINFFCLQFFGQFCSSLVPSQVSAAQSNGAAAQSAAAAAPAASSN